jgi:RNA polymerase sigma factor (sigma-70 family)
MSNTYIKPDRATSQYHTEKIRASSIQSPIPNNNKDALVIKLYNYIVKDYSRLHTFRPKTIEAADAIGAIHRSLKGTTADGRREIVDQFLADKGIGLLDQYAPDYNVSFSFFLTCFLNWKKNAFRNANTKQQRFENSIVYMSKEDLDKAINSWDNRTYATEGIILSEDKRTEEEEMRIEQAFANYVATLSERDAMIIRLSFFTKMTSAEIARAVGLPDYEVRRRKQKLMDTFRATVPPHNPER